VIKRRFCHAGCGPEQNQSKGVTVLRYMFILREYITGNQVRGRHDTWGLRLRQLRRVLCLGNYAFL